MFASFPQNPCSHNAGLRNSGWKKLVAVSNTSTSCRSLLESVTLLFPCTILSTVPDPLGPHLCSYLLGAELGERQRVGAISAGSALPLNGHWKLVAAGLKCCGSVSLMLCDSAWTLICISKVGLGDLGVAGFDSSQALWCWNVTWLLSWKKQRNQQTNTLKWLAWQKKDH